MAVDADIYDVIVVGSGITGGWAAKELTERGLRTLMIERGRKVEHGVDYPTEHVPVQDFRFRLLGDRLRIMEDFPVQSTCRNFSEATFQFFLNDRENPYTTEPDRPFTWIRANQLGGKSLIWGRQCYRMSQLNFEENGRDGHGVDWPIRYAELAPWYEHVERFIGVSGSALGHPMLPDGIYQKPYPMNAVEDDLRSRLAQLYPDRPLTMGHMANLTEPLGDRQACHYCGTCERGCTAGAYFSTQSSTLPAAQATGRLEILTDHNVERLLFDGASGRVTGVRAIDAKTTVRKDYRAKIVFLCASTLESVRLLFNSATEAFPDGLANASGALGRYIMDHKTSDMATVSVEGPQLPNYWGFRPAPLTVPRFRNVSEQRADYVRGYNLFSLASPEGWTRGATTEGFGSAFKESLKTAGRWKMFLVGMLECLPQWNNRVTIDPSQRDSYGVPVIRCDVTWGANERAMHAEASDTVFEMMTKAGYADVQRVAIDSIPGASIHEMGGATMGRDHRTSVLDGFNRTHDIPNLYVTDGSAMASSSSVNPSLTYMALTARAAAHAADAWRRNDI